ncbi:MAG: HTH-type transcriptional activator mta [Candidatus Marinimicrobia bacterium]|nr:HTH-type transcriptional activator mta [Candidatus Neomarinimicrobiota bacterium]
MKQYTVKELAKLAGISVRTLHHYDEINLLKPAERTHKRYRLYGEDELLRLQQILFYRELDFPLEEIKAILDAPDFDTVEALKEHKSALISRKKRLEKLLTTIDKTIAKMEKGSKMIYEELYDGIPVHYGDGTAFLTQPPFTVIANMLRLSLNPANFIILQDLLSENSGWNYDRIHSLITLLNTNDISIFGENSLGLIPQDGRDDLEDLRSVYQSIAQSLDSNRPADAIEEICDHYLAESSLPESDRLKKETLIELAEESDGDVEDFLEQMQLNPYTDAGRLKTEGVHLLTFHAAKGLEFPVVFIASAEESISPLDREGIDMEEERRLFYVAMTRAEDELQIPYTSVYFFRPCASGFWTVWLRRN